MRSNKWYWLSTPIWTVSVDIDKYGKIIDTAPITKWMIGKDITDILPYLQKRFGSEFKYKEFDNVIIPSGLLRF